jgi:cysteinyl-tRNA synthetase
MLRLYNSLTRRKEAFEPLRKDEVTMYNCGPTVYNYAHIGNFRSYIVEDLLRRYLEYKGYRVKEVMNVTDVGHMTSDADYGEDRMELAAKREKKTPEQIALHYEEAFFRDIAALNIKEAWKYPRATEHIEDMIALVKKLLEDGYAYVSNKSVYYDVTTFSRYGELSGNTLEKLKAGARIEVNPDKRNPWDFALWIYDPNHLMHWESPWNDHGYPGWHLECSVMSMKYLGETFDIHTGGEDNKFPHHESEIAQSEAATGKTFVKYWLHVKHLIIKSEKMSKSKGNFYTLQDLTEEGYSPRAVRYLLLSAYYRQQLNFTLPGLLSAHSAVTRLDEFIQNIQFYASGDGKTRNNVLRAIAKARDGFEDALDDDLNISLALGSVHDFMREMNKVTLNRSEASDVVELMLQFDTVLGLNLREATEKQPLPDEVKRLVEEREEARIAKNFDEADRIRDELAKKGFRVEDTPQGPKVKPLD